MSYVLELDPEVRKDLPGIRLNGQETGGSDLTLRENSGSLELYDEAADAVVSTWDLNPGLELGSLAAYDTEYNLMPEGKHSGNSGLDATTTGEKYTGQMTVDTNASMLDGDRTIRLEAAMATSTSVEVTVHLYDVTAAADIGTVVMTGDTQNAASTDLTGSFNAEGNTLRVDWEVTTTVSSGTWDAVGAKLAIE